MMDPTERNMSTRVIPHVMSEFFLSKVLARSDTVKETVWKSISMDKASHKKM